MFSWQLSSLWEKDTLGFLSLPFGRRLILYIHSREKRRLGKVAWETFLIWELARGRRRRMEILSEDERCLFLSSLPIPMESARLPTKNSASSRACCRHTRTSTPPTPPGKACQQLAKASTQRMHTTLPSTSITKLKIRRGPSSKELRNHYLDSERRTSSAYFSWILKA